MSIERITTYDWQLKTPEKIGLTENVKKGKGLKNYNNNNKNLLTLWRTRPMNLKEKHPITEKDKKGALLNELEEGNVQLVIWILQRFK